MKTRILAAAALLMGLCAPASARRVVAGPQDPYYGRVASSGGGIRVKVTVPEGGAISIQTMASTASPELANRYAPTKVRLHRDGKPVPLSLVTRKFSPPGSPVNPGWFVDTGYGLPPGTYTLRATFRSVLDGTAPPRGKLQFAVSSKRHP